MAGLTPEQDGSHFMRPFAFDATAFLLTLDILYLITRGAFHSPDRWSDVYMVILAVYAGAPEVKRWMMATERLVKVRASAIASGSTVARGL